ncbi:MAG: hypothetical protein EBU90_12730, partial [Proteobacteria bacterium]|nr:hypothetical protein [Pseudomonadota bacterium]
ALFIAGGVGIGQDLYASRIRTASTTNATSTQTGDIVVPGGIGIGQNLYVGGGVQATGLTTVTNTTNATNTSSGSLQTRGGLGVGGDLYASRIRTVSTTNATSTSTGEIIVGGGVGIGQDLWVGGNIYGSLAVTVSTASNLNTIQRAIGANYFLTFVDSNNATATAEAFYTSSTIKFDPTIGLAIGGTGAPTAALDVTGSVRISGISTVSNNTNASSTVSGALQVIGGAGIGGDLYASRIRTVSTTNATSTQTGEIIVAGGVGIGQDIWVGGDLVLNGGDISSVQSSFNLLNATVSTLNFAGAGTNITIGAATGATTIRNATTITNSTNATTTQTGALQVLGGAGIGGDLFVSRIRTVSTTQSTNTTTGEIVVCGGVGIGQDLYVGGVIYGQIAGASSTATTIYTTRASTASQYYLTFVDSNNAGTTTPEVLYSSATISFNPGVGFAIGGTASATAMLDVTGSARISGITTVSNTTNASSTITGALQVLGGAGIGGDLYASRIRTVSTTNATSTQTGEIVVRGGVGIGQDLHVGGNIIVTGTLYATNLSSTGTIVGTISTSTSSNNLIGGGPLRIVYQSNTNTTAFIQSPTGSLSTATATVILNYSTASGFTWTSVDSLVLGLGLDPIIDTFTGAGTTTTFALSVAPRSKNHVDVNIDGIDQLHNSYSVTGTNLVLSEIPPVGSTVEVTIFATTGTNFINGPAGINNSIQYNLAGNLAGANTFLYATTGVNLLVTTNAVNTQTGALQVSGGVGIGQNLYVGGGVGITGITTITNATNAVSSTTGALQVVGGVGIQGDVYARNIYSNGGLVGGGTVANPFSGIFTITNTTQATSTQTGALQVYGGVGIGGNLHVGGDVVANRLIIQYTTVTTTEVTTDDVITTNNTTNATNTNTGALRIKGGVGIGQDVWIGGNINVTGTINGSFAGTADNVKTIRTATNASYFLTFVDSNNATATGEPIYTTSSVFVNPTIGLAVSNKTNATTTQSGALIVDGGVGIGQDLYVGGNLNVAGTLVGTVSGTITTATNIAGGTAGQVPYQTGPGATSFFGPGTAGNILVSNGTGAPSYNNTLTLTGLVNATSTLTGALQVRAGVGIGQNLHVGGGTQIAGLTTITNTTNATSTITGALQVTGGIGVGGQVYAGGLTVLAAGAVDGSITAQATIISTGTFSNFPSAGLAFGGYYTAAGIAGFGGISMTKLNAVSGDFSSYLSLHTRNGTVTQPQEWLRLTNTGTVLLYGTTNATSTQTGALIVTGGVGIGQNLVVGGSLTVAGSTVITTGTGGVTSPFAGIFTVTNTTNAGNTQSGAIQVYGGVGVGGNLNVGGVITATNLFVNGFAVSTASGGVTSPFAGIFTITNTTQSFSTNTGALQVYGGVGIGGNLYATSKSFSIAHPTQPGKTLNYGSLEGPEFGVYVRGSLQNKNVIELPEYWTHLVDEQTISVSITPRGRRQEIYVEYIANNRIYLQGDDIDCYYIVFAERKDIDKIVVER